MTIPLRTTAGARSRYSRASSRAKFGSWVKGRLKSFKVLQRGVSPRVVKARSQRHRAAARS